MSYSHPLALERLADSRRSRGVDVLAAAIAIATHYTPTLKPIGILQQLDSFARDVRHMMAHNNDPLESLRYVFTARLGFHGNKHYHDPRNSCIDSVLARRTGLPILLALVFVETARRAGLTAHGIGLPGHFIAACDPGPDGGDPAQRVFIDVFHAAAILTPEDCRRAVAHAAAAASPNPTTNPPANPAAPGDTSATPPPTPAAIPWSDDYLLPITGAAWTIRMLSNLRTSCLVRNDLPTAAAILEQVLLIDPGNAARREELATLYHTLSRQSARNN